MSAHEISKSTPLPNGKGVRFPQSRRAKRSEAERECGNFEIFLRQHRTKLVRRLRCQVFRQIVQARRRRADARQGELVQYDGKYASKMRAKREARALCGVASNN